MRVKRLEIQGFKSFKDKTVIHFDHSITGIVGPNGCGKSNIVDAFFWVMGEQSYKHMRGNSSSDLIFNGSSKYSPLGMAEATLVMEISAPDHQNAPDGATTQDIPLPVKTKEVSVTRRLYREGEGEYFINGTSARLKDIHELFMDTGVGAKGYSVIEQGQIGKIVNSKPEERRLLIEEAAGIAKYKARKKESLKKMEATHSNLARLNDIIQEIERSLASLDRQAQKAKQYKKYKEELLHKEMTWGRRKRKVFQEQLQDLKARKEILEQELAGLKSSLQTSENILEVDRIHLLTETKEAETYQQNIQDLSHELSVEKNALDLSKRRQGDLESQLNLLSQEKLELESYIESDQAKSIEKEIELQKTDLSFQQICIQASEKDLQLRQVRQSTQESRNQLLETQERLQDQMNEISEFKSQLAALQGKQESAEMQLERIETQHEVQNEKVSHLEQELLLLREKFQDLTSQKEELHSERKNQSENLQESEKNLKKLEKEAEQSLRQLTQIQSKVQSLDELDQTHEGLSEGTRSALDWSKTNHQPLRPLTDFLQIKSGYEIALQSWLENQIENIISESPQAAVKAIAHLNKNKQGKVRVQIFKESEISNHHEKKSEFGEVKEFLESQGLHVLGQMKEFIQNSAPLPSIQQSLNHLCVVENLGGSFDPLEKLVNTLASSQIPGLSLLQGWSIVSLDGIVLDSQGILRGGSQETSGAVAVLKRKQVLEELRIQENNFQSHYDGIVQQVEESREKLELTRVRYQSLQSDIQSLEVQVAENQRDIHQTERALNEAKSFFQSLEAESNRARNEIKKAIEMREEIESQLEDFSVNKMNHEEELHSLQQVLQSYEENLKKEETEIQEIRIQEAAFRERLISLKREMDGLNSLLKDRSKRIQEVHRILERASQEKNQFSGGESTLEEKIREITHVLSEKRNQLSLIKDKIEQANASVHLHMEKMKSFHKELDRKSNDSNQLSIEIEKISGELSYLLLNLEEKYGPNCLETAPTHELVTENKESHDENESPLLTSPLSNELSPEEELALGEEVEKLKERIRRLGEVNLMAIEEHEQLSKRYDHLLTEKADLEKSLQNLQDAIEHINKTSIERFRKAFEAIADRFEKLFPIIFGGGQAKLSLIYPEGSSDILEAGVDILAQPPGKKVSNITLLSGGEKALTAVSLIFAIFMVKPSPFCVLDEVDAPLDDANIGKFNALLKEMSSKSQFILITHNKKTMELNDTLYGVTMEEPGVSKMVSIEMH